MIIIAPWQLKNQKEDTSGYSSLFHSWQAPASFFTLPFFIGKAGKLRLSTILSLGLPFLQDMKFTESTFRGIKKVFHGGKCNK